MRRIATVILLLVLVPSIIGCAGMSTTEQRTLSGAAIGAGGGAALGAVTGGSPAAGALIGGAAGAVGGYLYDQSKKDKR